MHRPGVNEELAATSVMGTQLTGKVSGIRTDGVAGVWYGKSPGLDRATDALRHANLIGTDPRGGAVALAGDDPAAKSSTLPVRLRAGAGRAGHARRCTRATRRTCWTSGCTRRYLSRCTGLWSALKIITAVADGGRARRGVHPERITPAGRDGHAPAARPGCSARTWPSWSAPCTWCGCPWRSSTPAACGLNRIVRSGPGDRIGLVAAGKTYFDLREALAVLGLDEPDLERLRASGCSSSA